MKKPIDKINVIYTPKKQMELETFLYFFPIVKGNGSHVSYSMKHSDGTPTRWGGIMEANIEYIITIKVYSFAKYLDFSKSSHP